MELGIVEDYSTDGIVLDRELTSLPASGLYLNSGVHPSITVNNLLQFLPFPVVVFPDWADDVEYGLYNPRSSDNIVTLEGIIYQSIKTPNENHSPDEEDSEYWMETNLESLKLKMFIQKVKDKVYKDLNFTKRLINSQNLYEVGTMERLLPNDYAAWVFEPKGSDYVTFKINQISLQKSGTTPVNLYVINQGVLIDTLQITPSNGIVDLKDLNYTFKGKGKWIFAIDSTEVFTKNSYIDPLMFDGFVCYTATGIGDAPETAKYSYGFNGNGIGFNISVYLDAQTYIDNNQDWLANFISAEFELMALNMFLHNPENRGNREQMMQMDKDALIAETKSLDMNTVAKRYTVELNRARKTIANTFDTQISYDDALDVDLSSN